MPVVRLSIKLIPGAPRNEVSDWREGECRIRITAPPVDGKANKALLEFLSLKLDVAKSRVRLVSGEKNRHKVVEVEGLEAVTIQARLKAGC